MFDTLSELQRAFQNPRGQGTITEENIGEAPGGGIFVSRS
jgi:hypothetical protein